ncbi:MAG TPA: hypothetical protein VI341_00985, partial [Actinomycetota bacterium]
ADITLTGAAAQLSRGLLPEISKKLTQQFADCLEASMRAEQADRAAAASPEGASAATDGPASGDPRPAAVTPKPVAKPVGGIGLGLAAIWGIIKNFFRKLFGGGKSQA